MVTKVVKKIGEMFRRDKEELLNIPANGSEGEVLKCDLDYFETKLYWIKLHAAKLYELEENERFLTKDEKKMKVLLDEELELHLKDLKEKCGITLTKEQLFEEFRKHPEYLDMLLKAGFEITEKKEEETK